MNSAQADEWALRYREIVRLLAPVDVDAIWAAVLFNRSKNLPAHLRPAAAALESLYDEIGKNSARRALERGA